MCLQRSAAVAQRATTLLGWCWGSSMRTPALNCSNNCQRFSENKLSVAPSVRMQIPVCAHLQHWRLRDAASRDPGGNAAGFGGCSVSSGASFIICCIACALCSTSQPGAEAPCVLHDNRATQRDQSMFELRLGQSTQQVMINCSCMCVAI